MYVSGFGAPVADPGAEIVKKQRLQRQKKRRKARREAAKKEQRGGKKAQRGDGVQRLPPQLPVREEVPQTNYTVTSTPDVAEDERGWLLPAAGGLAVLVVAGLVWRVSSKKGRRR